MTPGPWQILIILVVILLLFGASRLADIGKGLGEGIKNFKKGLSDDDKDAKNEPKSLPPKGESASDSVAASDRKQA
jgi:sec-independent protein translocase protein TatA